MEMSKSVEIWLIRHGETEWSLSGAHTGRTDIPLSDRGRSSARCLGRFLANRPFVLTITSPLQRARETCELAGFGSQALVSPELQEWDYGIYEGTKTADLKKDNPEWSIWTADVRNGESLADLGERANNLIARIADAGGDVALFGHGHFFRILAACWIGLPPEGGRCFGFDTAGISVLGYERKTRVIRHWNRVLTPQECGA
jgi:probable phosphoglycerate mutase